MAWRIQATYVTANNPDFAYTLATIGLISGLELWLGIAVACMPTIPPVMQAYVRPVFRRLTLYYYHRRGASGGGKGGGSSSHEPVASYDIPLQDRSREAFGGPAAGASGLSTEVSSPPDRGQPTPTRGLGGLGRALRGNRNVNPYESIDDERYALWTARGGSASHTHVRDEEPGTAAGGIAVNRELNLQEEYRHGTSV